MNRVVDDISIILELATSGNSRQNKHSILEIPQTCVTIWKFEVQKPSKTTGLDGNSTWFFVHHPKKFDSTSFINFGNVACQMGYSRKNPNRGLRIFFSEKPPLEILDLSLTPRNFGEKKLLPLEVLQICVTPLGNSDHGNSALVFLEHPWNFHFFFNWPLEFPHVFSWRPLEIPGPQLPVWIFFWNSPMRVSSSIPQVIWYLNRPCLFFTGIAETSSSFIRCLKS